MYESAFGHKSSMIKKASSILNLRIYEYVLRVIKVNIYGPLIHYPKNNHNRYLLSNEKKFSFGLSIK